MNPDVTRREFSAIEEAWNAERHSVRVSACEPSSPTRPPAGSFRRLKVIQRTYDEATRALVSSCKPGCSACCDQHVLVTRLEAELIVHNMRARYGAGELVRVAASCQERLALAGMGMDAWWNARLTCPLLGEDLRCKVYNVRPSVCRSHNVRSEPGLCGVRPVEDVLFVVAIKDERAMCGAIDKLHADVGADRRLRSLHVQLFEIITRELAVAAEGG
jgi:Fe-S-cluster containining protein